MSLLLALVASSVLVAVAAPAQVASAAGTYFAEDFSSGLPANLVVSQGSPQSTAGAVTFSDTGTIVRTTDINYQTDSFCAGLTVVSQNGNINNRAYLGFGRGALVGGDADFPRQGPAVIARSVGNWLDASNFINNLTVMAAPTAGLAGTEVFNRSGIGPGSGPYLMQLQFDAGTRRVVVFADGAPYGPSVDVSGYDFSADGRVFFGGRNITVDDLSVQAGPCSAPSPLTFTVNSTGDESDANRADAVCDTGAGTCTLRAAIESANANRGADTIAFSIPDAGPHTISPATPFEPLYETVTIDGYTQPGSARNTLTVGNNADLRVVVSGSTLLSPGGAGLDLSDSIGSRVSGLVVNGFSDGFSSGSGIVAGPQSLIDGNFIGTDATGAVSRPNFHGVSLPGVDNVAVGGTAPGSRNLISGNTNFGVHLTDDADGNQIVGNYIGTNRTGTAALGNNYGIVLAATGGARLNDNVIGGAVPGAGNVVSGNVVGVRVDFADDTSVLGNLIGTDSTGLGAIANGVGIDVGTSGSSPATETFRTTIGDGTSAGRNVVSGNNSEGISLWNSTDDNVIRGNYIGVGADGGTPLGNNAASTNPDIGGYGGIVLRNFSSGNRIGGLNPGEENVIANNNNGVVTFSGLGNEIIGNRMYSNSGRGIWVFGSDVNDPGDLDDNGPWLANRGQNFPVLSSFENDSAELIVTASIDSDELASTYPIRIEVFGADDPVAGEGLELLGAFDIEAPGEVVENLGALDLQRGTPLVATATDAEGNTSNFSEVSFADQPSRLAQGDPGDAYGASISVDGNSMVVGSPAASAGEIGAGLVRVYQRTSVDDQWALLETIQSPDPEVGGGFGDTVALSGNLLAVGESDRFGGADEPGRVHVFRLGDVTPYLGEVTAPVAEPGDEFGAALAWLSGTLGIGAPGTDAERGRTYRVNPNLIGSAPPDPSPIIATTPPEVVGLLAPGDRYGAALDIGFGGGGIVSFVGAPGTDGTFGGSPVVDAGAVYRLDFDSGGNYLGFERGPDVPAGARLGSAIAVDRNPRSPPATATGCSSSSSSGTVLHGRAMCSARREPRRRSTVESKRTATSTSTVGRSHSASRAAVARRRSSVTTARSGRRRRRRSSTRTSATPTIDSESRSRSRVRR